MIDLNNASLAEFTAAGLAPALAREVGRWRPYRTWDQLLQVAGFDQDDLEKLRGGGFKIASSNDTVFSPPRPFRLSVVAA